MIGVAYPNADLVGSRVGRRPGHSSDRTVRGTRRPDHPGPAARPPPTRAGPATRGDRRGTGLPGRGAGPATPLRRTPLAACRAVTGRAPVPAPAGAKRVQ